MTEPAAEDLNPGRTRLGPLLSVGGALSVVALLVFGVMTRAEDRSIDEALSKGSAPAAPEFDLEILEIGTQPSKEAEAASSDGQMSLTEFAGTPVVLNFWASWCTPCEEEAPVLEQSWRRWSDRGVLFLGVNTQDLSDNAHEFIDEFDITFPNVRDPSRATALDYGATGMPETYFIDQEGRVVGHVIGVLSAPQLDDGARAAKEARVLGTVTGADFRPLR